MFKKFHQHLEYILVSSYVCKSPRYFHSFSKLKAVNIMNLLFNSLALTEWLQVVENKGKKKKNKTVQMTIRISSCSLCSSLKLILLLSFCQNLPFFLYYVSSYAFQPKIAPHRLSSLPQLNEFGLGVDERTRNNIHAR